MAIKSLNTYNLSMFKIINIKKYFNKLNLDQAFWKNFKYAFILGAVIHIIAAIFSEGFHRPDEQLGIMQYVGLKLNKIELELLSSLSWEYPAAIRNWLQPGFYFLIAKFLQLLGVESPFVLATFFRLISSLLALSATAVFTLVTAPHISKGKWQNLLPYIATMLWWIPFFHARTTAENFGTMTAQLALVSIFFFMPAQLWQSTSLRTFLSKKGAWAPPPAMALLGGFLIGLAFNLRIPLVAVVPFIALWAIFSRLKISSLILIILGVLIAIGATILTDYWGYGRWTYSTYNWFWWELVHGVSKQFGTDPWWAYLTKISSRAIPPISILLLISFIWFWIKYPFHLLTWVTFSFFVAHSAMGHKEMRFMFPLSAFAPFIVCQTLYDLEHGTFFKKLFNGIWWKILSSIFISINIIAMLYSSLIPAYSGISLYKFLYKQQQTITQLNTIGVVRDPLYFYMKVPFTNNLTDDPQKIEQVLNQQSLQNKYFLATRWQQRSMIEKYPQCVSVFQSRPQWVIDLMPEKMLLKSEVFSLFSCQ